MVIKLLQFENALSPIEVTELGIIIPVIDVDANASLLMVVTLSGIVNDIVV
jgi:hypothetical protein